MKYFVKTPRHYWLVVGVLMVFYALLFYDYLNVIIKLQFYFTFYSQAQQYWLENLPLWYFIPWSISILAAFCGGVFMILRRRHAYYLFGLSLISYVLSTIWSYALADPSIYVVMGWGATAVAVVMILSLLFAMNYCANMHDRGVME